MAVDNESLNSVVAVTHVVNTIFSAVGLGLFGIFLRQHKVWIRVKDRMNLLWADYCRQHQINYTSLDGNGKGD